MLKAAVPGPYTLAGPDRAERRLPRPLRRDRGARPDRARRARCVSSTRAARSVTVDEPSMSCYAWIGRTSPRLVDVFNRTVEPVVGSDVPRHAPLLRQLQGAGGRAAAVRADVPGVPAARRRRAPPRDGEPRVRRARADPGDRLREGRRRRRDRRQELRTSSRRTTLRNGSAPVCGSSRPSGCRCRRTAGCRRRHAGRRAES